jgi:hypothetical protein
VQQAKTTGKVYAVDQLPNLMSGAVTQIQVHSPLVFRVEYPWWPALLWIALFVIAAGIAVLIVRALAGIRIGPSREWEVRAETERGTAVDCVTENGRVSVQRELFGTVVKNSFMPAGGILLEGGQNQLSLASGMKVKARSPRREVCLLFTDNRKKAGDKAATAAYVPRRR